MRDRDRDRAGDDEPEPGMDPDIDSDIDGPEDDAGAFHDPVLRRALAYASDHAVVPLDETRESIRAFAHEAVAPSLPAAPYAARRNLLQRVLGLRGGAGIGAHIPWNAVLAMVVVGAVVLVRDRRSAGDSATEPSVAVSEVAGTPAMPDATSAAQAVAPAASEPALSAASAVPAFSAASASSAPGVAADVAPTPPPAAVPPPLMGLPTLAAPAVEAPADAAARLQLEQKLQRLEAAEARARLAQQSDAGGLPTSLFPSALPKTAIPVEVPRAGRAAAASSGSALPATSSAGAGRVEDASPPNFVALSQWTRLTITPAGGESRRIARSEAGELGALVGSAALAGVGTQPLSGRVDWRVAFERNGEQLATLETAGNQIRWKENGMAAGTGVPSGNALASLRQALKQVQVEAARPAAPTVSEPAPAAVPAASPAPVQPEATPATPAPAFEMPR